RLLCTVLDQELMPELEGLGVALERASPYRHQHKLQIGAPAHLALFDHAMLLVRDVLYDRLQALGTLRPALGIARPARSEAGTPGRFPVADALLAGTRIGRPQIVFVPFHRRLPQASSGGSSGRPERFPGQGGGP